MNFFGKTKRSLPRGIPVCDGAYEVRRLTNGEFFEGVGRLQESVVKILRDVSANEGIFSVLDMLSSGDVSAAVKYLFISGDSIMQELIKVVADFSRIPEDVLRDEMGPKDLADVIAAIVEVNEIADFFNMALPPMKRVWQGLKSGMSDGEKSTQTAQSQL